MQSHFTTQNGTWCNDHRLVWLRYYYYTAGSQPNHGQPDGTTMWVRNSQSGRLKSKVDRQSRGDHLGAFDLKRKWFMNAKNKYANGDIGRVWGQVHVNKWWQANQRGLEKVIRIVLKNTRCLHCSRAFSWNCFKFKWQSICCLIMSNWVHSVCANWRIVLSIFINWRLLVGVELPEIKCLSMIVAAKNVFDIVSWNSVCVTQFRLIIIFCVLWPNKWKVGNT